MLLNLWCMRNIFEQQNTLKVRASSSLRKYFLIFLPYNICLATEWRGFCRTARGSELRPGHCSTAAAGWEDWTEPADCSGATTAATTVLNNGDAELGHLHYHAAAASPVCSVVTAGSSKTQDILHIATTYQWWRMKIEINQTNLLSLTLFKNNKLNMLFHKWY